MTSPSTPSKVSSLVNHFDLLASPPPSLKSPTLSRSPSTQSNNLPIVEDLLTTQSIKEEAIQKENIVEEKVEKDDVKVEGEKEEEVKVVKEDLSVMEKILESLPALSIKEQEAVQKNIQTIGGYPTSLPLSASWTLFFSDTSKSKSSSHSTADQYIDLQTPLFTVDSVENFCGSLKAYKRLARSKRARASDPDSMGLSGMRPGMNLYFFLSKAMPAWENVWNEKGGRLTISPPSALFDATFEKIVLLLAGSSLESATQELLKEGTDEGLIIGCVASRRARGDRIELWLGGKVESTPAPSGWVEALKEVLNGELGKDCECGKFKKHF